MCLNSGELHMKRSLDDLRLITKLNTPVVLRVVAEEVITARDNDGDNSEEMISSEAELAIILPGSLNTPPLFESERYNNNNERFCGDESDAHFNMQI
jgi:hypothetical protein